MLSTMGVFTLSLHYYPRSLSSPTPTLKNTSSHTGSHSQHYIPTPSGGVQDQQNILPPMRALPSLTESVHGDTVSMAVSTASSLPRKYMARRQILRRARPPTSCHTAGKLHLCEKLKTASSTAYPRRAATSHLSTPPHIPKGLAGPCAIFWSSSDSAFALARSKSYAIEICGLDDTKRGVLFYPLRWTPLKKWKLLQCPR